ncbi:MAG: efflux transporter periplasmic adaptor subunit, partial [Nitrospinaceae bacterium]|nr:efflux RND transporter periplasmic adaptor subunit [Nitrospinaceae bacterium]NIS86066.1 efflux RND transporter periplasmic adaptor subunit [Nitrospinaceae bacterium]NIT82909.1 efflux RND transporter periplasmic adaptor subunit [Nitrospinaceae bacterium]NIU45114.1 efflux RND transporter periplasmic adaptor subunit [Nitrospinaceae bacterium]NIU97290.1 efflux transporter periplasmic adaptor subunit [Nitrospinaceae bacterium]
MSLRRPGFWILLGMVGAALVWVLLLKPPAPAPPPSLEKAALEKPSTPSPPHGPRGGWLFAEDSFRLELKIYEQGVPPRFRAYVTDDRGHPLDLSQVHLTAELHRLDRVDRIGFKPAGEYLRGDAVVEEPHSFEVVLKARWKDQTFQWNFSQIEGRAELSPEVAREAGIETATAGPATLKNTLTLNGEIGLNEEKVTHIVPRLDGVVREVHTDLGDQVTDRELLAVLESRELADA